MNLCRGCRDQRRRSLWAAPERAFDGRSAGIDSTSRGRSWNSFCSACCCWRFRSSPSWRWSRRSTSTTACARWKRASPRSSRASPARRARRRRRRAARRRAAAAPVAAPPAPAAAEPPRLDSRRRRAAAEPAPPPPPPAPPAAAGEPERVDQLRGDASAPAGWSGSAASRSRSAASSWCNYSIEAGLIGPGLRLFFGALLAAALVAGGEWTRRQEQLAGFAGLPTARHPEHPDRRRHHRRLCHGLCGLRALRLPRSGLRLRAARRGRAGDARGGAAARPGAGGARPRRRLCDAAAGRLRRAELLGALHLSRRGDGGGLRAGAHAAVALARDHRRRLRLLLDAAGHRRRAASMR